MNQKSALPFRWDDFAKIDLFLNDEELHIRDTTRKFVEDNIIPTAGANAEAGVFPMHLVEKMGAMGFLGPTLKGYGCDDPISGVAYGTMMQELERGDSAVRSFASVQNALVMYPIWAFGSKEQKSYWLPLLRAGKKIGCFGLSESEAASNPAEMQTIAELDGDAYVLNGHKMWITSGCIADVAIVWAREGNIVRGFLVEKNTPGFKTETMHGKWSLRASVTSELEFINCRVPSANILPNANGISAAYKCLTQARYGIGWGSIGAAMACYDFTRQYALQRKVAGGVLASKQLVQEKLSWMLTEITNAQLLALHCGRLKDISKLDHPQVSMLKMNNVRMALDIARACRDILGANGIMYEYVVGRHMLNLETVVTYEGTQDIHALILGQSITGIPAF